MVVTLSPDDEDFEDAEEWDGSTDFIDEEVPGEVTSGCLYWGEELEVYD